MRVLGEVSGDPERDEGGMIARCATCGFEVGQPARYRPGSGTYGYEHLIETDGRVPVTVVGFTPTRIRIALPNGRCLMNGRSVVAVDAASLEAV